MKPLERDPARNGAGRGVEVAKAGASRGSPFNS